MSVGALRSARELASVECREPGVEFIRASDLPGVELRRVEYSSRPSYHCCVGFEFVASLSWRGAVSIGKHRGELSPGWLFCGYPGEAYALSRVHEAGDLRALFIEGELLANHFAGPERHDAPPNATRTQEMSRTLAVRLYRLFEAFHPQVLAPERRQRLYDFLSLAVDECAVSISTRAVRRPGSLASEPKSIKAEPQRNWWHDGEEHCRLSRFQRLRTFKRLYGVPPHTYQLCQRVGMAQRALRAGASPADVAAQCGFVDQSHLARHFKRIVGVTPGVYASLATANGVTSVHSHLVASRTNVQYEQRPRVQSHAGGG